MIDAGRMGRTEELFHRAMEQPASERTAKLTEWCAGDADLCRDVEELLEAELAVEQAMAAAPPVLQAGVGEIGSDTDDEDVWEGRVVGDYRLLSLLGRGGMGVVYLAERLPSGEHEPGSSPAETGAGERVAIKFVRRSLRGAVAGSAAGAGAGSGASPALQHFLLERDTLAALQHPYIARLLDGGVFGADAVPYVVMELIEGERLDAVCDAPGCSARTVVELVLQLCDAVGFAHRNLVLHRDLKPGNVLVRRDGAVQQVKLLDFGTLKMLGPDAEQSAMTQAGVRPVTLRYAAPEHVLGEPGAPVTTAADVYSLGVVLYRLLAARLPPELESRDILGWFDHLKNGRVTPPSAMATRHTPRELAEDLDAIALKAMRYEPEARYRSAQAMGDDLRRALEARPVLARGDDRRYRLGRLYRRNRGVVWAAAAAALVLCAGLLTMRHETAVALAQEQAASAGVEQERVLAHTLLFDYFVQLQQLPGSTDAQKHAVTEANAYLDRLSATTPSRAVTLETVRGYTAMGTLLGSPYFQNLGDPPGALRTLDKALPLARGLLASDPGNPEVQKALAGVHFVLAQVLLGEGKPKDALPHLQAAGDVYSALAARPDADVKAITNATNVLSTLADTYSHHGNGTLRDPPKAIAYLQQTLVIFKRCEQIDNSNASCPRGEAIAYTKLGTISEGTDVPQARAYYDQALTALGRLPPAVQQKVPVQRSYSIIRTRLIALDVYENKLEAAEPLMRDERAFDAKAVAADPMDARALFDQEALDENLIPAYFSIGNHAAALASCERDLQLAGKLVALQPKNPNWTFLLAEATLAHGRALLEGGQKAAGQAEGRRGLGMILPLANEPDAEPDALNTAADYLALFGRDPAREGPEAVQFAQRAITLSGAPEIDGLLLLARTERFAGQPAEADTAARGALKLLAQYPNSLGHAADVAEAKRLAAK